MNSFQWIVSGCLLFISITTLSYVCSTNLQVCEIVIPVGCKWVIKTGLTDEKKRIHCDRFIYLKMETLTNFCLDPFISHLFSSSVSADGYAPNNLTSTNTQIKTRGFRVEHFIRPPVSIEFVFKVPVHVACILLKPDLEDNSEARFAFTGSSHTASQKPNSAADGYEFTLHSGVVAKGPNVVVHLKNRAYDRMWYHNIDISSETVSMVTGSYLNNDLNGAHIIEQPVKHLNIASRLRQLKVTVTRLSGIKPFALKCIEVWGTLTGTSNHSEKVAFHSALECLEANPHSTVPQLSLGVFNHHSLLPLDGVEQRQPNVIAPNDLHKVQDNSVSSSVTPPNCFPLSALTCGTLEQHIQSKPCHSQSSIHANRPTSTANNLTTKLSVVKPGLIETLPHYQRPYGKRGSTFPQASGYYNTKKPKMEASVTVPAEDSLKPLTCVGHTSTSSGCEEYKLNSNHNSAPHSKCINCNIIPNWKQTNSCHHSDSTLNDECTPSKFLDSITYDVMLLPMLLPSGHYVDRSTIDKLAINDTLYGRPPTDPFTGELGCVHSKLNFNIGTV